jgi:16S rRNA (guanine(1405)-N(7))-methyltransferase
MPPTDLGRVLQAVQTAAKYAGVDPTLIAAVAQDELTKGRSVKEAVKATKSKLHQVTGAYLPDRPAYSAWLAQLEAAQQRGDVKSACRAVMAHHASTRERLPVLDRFYATVLADLGPLTGVLDLACGLNPLALPWLDLASGADYCACDIDHRQMDFLNRAFALLYPAGTAQVCNLLAGVPARRAQVALLLKTIPCLEQLDKEIGPRLLAQIDAPVIVVSYPAASLGGRRKGMVESYGAAFAALVAGQPWRVTRFDFPGELVFRIER